MSRIARSGDLERARDMWFHHRLFATARRDPAMAARMRAAISADACSVRMDADREMPPAWPHIECLGDLALPVLLITGADDVEDFRVIAEIVAAMVPEVRRVDLPDTGHLAHLERPAEAAAQIRDFLT